MSSGVDERMDYAMMEEMARLFNEAARQVDDTIAEMLQIASMMEEGALVGQTGEVFVNALRVDLKSRLDRVQDKLVELSGDITGAIAHSRDGIADARSRFI